MGEFGQARQARKIGGVKAVKKEVKCWCCSTGAYIVVMGRYPLCMECGGHHFRGNRLVKQAMEICNQGARA